jgi:GTP cyclohydrolase I
MDDNNFSDQDWRRLLSHLGEDPTRQGLLETPQRVDKAWKHWTSGYNQNPADILKVFEDGAEHYNELIVVRGIPVYSHCEHHLAPFFGTATVGYTPKGKIVGLSKLTRLVECFSKRLQVQERLTIQIANSLMEHLEPLSVGVVIRCRHMCMESRGIRTPGQETVTSAMLAKCRPIFRCARNSSLWQGKRTEEDVRAAGIIPPSCSCTTIAFSHLRSALRKPWS